jgi:NADH-quinone oxidoreductase subunit M
MQILPIPGNLYLLITLLILVVGSVVTLAAGKAGGKAAAWSCFVFALISSLIFFANVLPVVLSSGSYSDVSFVLVGDPFNFVFQLYADGLSAPIAAIILGLSTFTALYSVGYMEKESNPGSYFSLYLLYMAGMVGVVLATNLIIFYVFWELMLIPSWIMIAKWGGKHGEGAVGIGFKYFIFTHLGAMCLLFAIGATWIYTGSFDLLTMTLTGIPQLAINIIVILYMIGFGVKLALFPVHTWLPDAHAEAPTPISVLLSGVMIETGGYAIARILNTYFGTTIATYTFVLSTLAVVTMYWGGIMALVQKDTKRLFAYSSISQMGYLFLGLVSATSLGIAGSMFHIINHALCKGLLFMVAGCLMVTVGHTTGRNIDELGGLGAKMPITATITLIAGLSIAGTPPLIGFAAEWLIFAGSFSAGNYLLATLGVIGSALTAGYILWFVKRVFFGDIKPGLEDVKEAPAVMLVPMAILAFFAVILGIFPNLVLQFILPAVAGIGVG